VDQAVELDLPDGAARRALLELYRGRLKLDGAQLDEVAQATDGVTASFLKELLRRAAVLSAEGGDAPSGTAAPLTVSGEHLRAALGELQETRNAMTRLVLGAGPARRSMDGPVD
jgi:hypothetical protein